MVGGDAFHLFFLKSVSSLRGSMGSMADETTDRMPIAYIHLVEVLVDLLLVLSPLALYPETVRQIAAVGACVSKVKWDVEHAPECMFRLASPTRACTHSYAHAYKQARMHAREHAAPPPTHLRTH